MAGQTVAVTVTTHIDPATHRHRTHPRTAVLIRTAEVTEDIVVTVVVVDMEEDTEAMEEDMEAMEA
jgi:ketosteroid isomerase-like protein